MRTPLSAILGFAQLMESGCPSPTASQKRSIERILQAGWHLEKLISMTRDLALIESGTLSLSLEPVPLAAIMLDVSAMIESQAQMRGVRVAFPSCTAPCWVSADRIRLQEVLGRLLAAAIEYCERDAVIVVDCETDSPEWIRIGIKDGGAGSWMERLTRCLQPLDALEQDATATDGTGIGLLLARRLIEWMGGAIGSQSQEGSSHLICIDLRRVIVPTAADRAATDPAFGDAADAVGVRPQNTVYPPDNHVHQHQ